MSLVDVVVWIVTNNQPCKCNCNDSCRITLSSLTCRVRLTPVTCGLRLLACVAPPMYTERRKVMKPNPTFAHTQSCSEFDFIVKMGKFIHHVAIDQSLSMSNFIPATSSAPKSLLCGILRLVSKVWSPIRRSR